MEKKKVLGILKDVSLIFIAAFTGAIALHVFVYSNSFSPSGMSGIATMLQEVTKLNAGIYTILLNAPLLVPGWVMFDKKFVYYTIIFTVFSASTIYLLDIINFYQYTAESERLLAAIFSGIIMGAGTGLVIKVGGSSGGVDIVACAIQKKNSHINVERIIAVINYAIILVSILVYKDLNCVLLSLVQMYLFEVGMNFALKDSRDTVEFKIITKHPDALKEKIITELKHGATVLNSRGMYTGDETNLVISIVHARQIPKFLEIVKDVPDTFVYYSKVMGIRGKFRWSKSEDVK
ncbi:MAG: YitT family protein [Clostridia bacterium]|nr:YitT family protein [Clostridia bacterium]